VAVARGRYEEALVHLQNAQALHDSFAPGGVDTLADIARRGLVLLEQGRQEQAWPLFEDVLARGAMLDGAFDALADAQVGKARVLLARGQAARALPLAQGAVATLTPKRGKGHPVTLQARLLVADIHQALGQREQVEKEARDVLAEALAEFDEGHVLAIRAKALLTRGPAEASAAP
jgi:hypothetical protein